MTPAARPYSLLITDDDAAARETLRDIFEPAGYRTSWPRAASRPSTSSSGRTSISR